MISGLLEGCIAKRLIFLRFRVEIYIYIYVIIYIYIYTRSLKVGRVGDETMFVTGTFLTLLLSVTFWVSNQNGLTGQVLVMQP